MLNVMDRSTIYLLHQKGWANVEIADFLGHHRDTIARVLREPLDQHAATRQRTSSVAVFDAQIRTWLDQQLSVQRMLDLARSDPDHPYRGKDAAFYDYVRPIKRARKLTPDAVPIRFAGVPGELLQIDGGNPAAFPSPAPSLVGQTRYFFAARLKYSRFMFVRFTTEMREETLLRCLIACFVQLGGVPWVVTSDHMKTITLGRDSAREPISAPGVEAVCPGVWLSPGRLYPHGGQPARRGREPGQVREGQLPGWAHLLCRCRAGARTRRLDLPRQRCSPIRCDRADPAPPAG